jgi:hypothetical protein
MQGNNIYDEVNRTYTVLLETFSSVAPAQIDIIPFEGSWTAGQLAEHIIKAGTGMPQFLRGTTKPTERQPEEKVEPVKALFLNFDIKMKSPDFILPKQTVHQKDAQLRELENIQKGILEAVSTLDLTVACLDSELPGFGELTRKEWIYFNAFHTQRHTRQLKNILAALS